MRRPKRFILVSIAFLLLLASAAFAKPVALTILHTNDTHGHLVPFSYPGIVQAGSDLAGLEIRSNIGGIARRATLVRRIRTELRGRDVPVWLVDAGDFSDGTPFSTEYHGEADVAAMNAVGYDFATLGNHEFNYHLAQTKKLLSLARYPILCANAHETTTGKLLVPAYTIQSIGPIKIALFGLVTVEAATYPAAKEGVTITDEVETARRMVSTLRPQADIIIAISHSGEEVDRRIAGAVSEIDVIIGGHSHSRLPVGEFTWRSEDLKVDDVNGTVIVQDHQWGGELGRLDLLFVQDEKGVWHVDRYRERLIPVTADIPADEAVAAVVDRFWKPIASLYGEIVGQAAADFSSRCDDQAEYNLMTDAIRATFGTDIVLENIGGVRSPLVKGNITRGDLVAMDPFNNTIVTFKINGRALRQLLKEQTPAVSGLRYRVERSKVTEATCTGRPLEDDQIYTGAANSYFAGNWLKGLEVKDTGQRRLDVLINYIREKGTVTPAYDGRRVVIEH
jgi:5'-nucleotidase/UDP-sugar diphosphatase